MNIRPNSISMNSISMNSAPSRKVLPCILAFAFVCSAGLLFAQSPPRQLAWVSHATVSGYSNPLYDPGVYLLGDNVSLRSGPGKQSEVLTVLPIGTHLSLLEQSEDSLQLDGIRSFWYRTEVNGMTGWVWGGMIARFAFRSHRDPTVKFFAGPEKLQWQDGQWRMYYEVRAIRAGKQLDKISVPVAAADYLHMFSCESLGLENLSDAFCISGWWDDTQGYSGGSYIAWTGAAFARIIELPVPSEKPYSERKELVFPSNMEGKPGRLILVSHTYRDADLPSKIELVTSRDYYRWDGTQMVLTGEPAVITSRLLDKKLK